MRLLDRAPHMDRTLQPVLASVARHLVLIFVMVAVLAQFGVQTTSIIALPVQDNRPVFPDFRAEVDDAFLQQVSASSRKWVVLTRFQERRRLAREVKEKLLQHFPGQVLATPVRETVALAESPVFGQTIFEYQARSNGAADYRLLAGDLMAERVMS